MANIYVGEGGDYTTLQAAIDAAASGDTIILKGDLKEASISIEDKDLTIDLGGFTLTGKSYIKGSSDVEFKNGTMTSDETDPAFNSAVITTSGESSLTVTAVTVDGGNAINSRNYTHAIRYASTGGLTVTDSTIVAGTATRTADCPSIGSNSSTAVGIYAPTGSAGDITITNSSVTGGYGYTDAEWTGYVSQLFSPGGLGISLHGSSDVTIENSTVTGGGSNWYNANNAINVSNQFTGTLDIKESTIKGGSSAGLAGNYGTGGVGIYTHNSTTCEQIDITDSTISGGDGGKSFNGNAIEYRNANINMNISGSTIEAGNGENASGNAAALSLYSTSGTNLVLDDVKLNGEGDGNTAVKGGDKGITAAGPIEITGGELKDTEITVDATGLTGSQEIISGNTGDGVNVSVSGNENAVVVEDGGKTYITTETDPTAADTSVIYVNNAWEGKEANALVGVGKFLGVNAFANANDAEAAAEGKADKMVIDLGADVTYDKDMYYFLNTDPNTGGENNAFDNVVDASETYDMEVNGTLRAYQILLNNANTTVNKTGRLLATGEALRVMGGSITVEGNRVADAEAPEKTDIFTGSWGGGTKPGDGTQISAGYFMVNQQAVANFNDTVIFVAAGVFNVDNAEAEFNNSYIYLGSVGTYQDVQFTLTNNADVTLGANTTVINDEEFGMHITVDGTSKLTLSSDSQIVATTLTVADGGQVVIDTTDFSGFKKVLDLSDSTTSEGKVTLSNEEGIKVIYGEDGDVSLCAVDTATLFVNAEYEGEFGEDLGNGKFFGINAFNDFESALAAASKDANISRIEIESDLTTNTVNNTSDYFDIAQDLTIGAAAGKDVTVSIKPPAGSIAIRVMGDGASLKLEDGVKIDHLDVVADGFATSNEEMVIDGELHAVSLKVWTNNNGITVNETGKVVLAYGGDGQLDLAYGNGYLNVNGTLADTTDASLTDGPQFKAGYSGTRGDGNTINLNDTYFEGGAWFNVNGSNGTINMDNSVLKVSGGDVAGSLTITSSGNAVNVDNGSRLIVAKTTVGAGNEINVNDSSLEVSNLTNNGTVNVTGNSKLNIAAASGNNIQITADTTLTDSNVAGNLAVGFNNENEADTTLALAGKNDISMLYVGKEGRTNKYKLSIAGEDTEVTLGQLYSRTASETVIGDGATVDVDYWQSKGSVLIDDATVNHTGFNMYVYNNDSTDVAEIKLTNGATLNSNANYAIYLGNSESGPAKGNASLVLESGSTVNTKNLIVHADGEVEEVPGEAAKASVSVTDSTLNVAGTLTNNGTVNVSGDSKLNIANVSGNRINVAAGTTLTDSKVGGSINMLGDLTITDGLELTGGLWASDGGTLSGDTLTAYYAMFQKATYTIDADLELDYGYLSFGGTFDVKSKIHTVGKSGEVLYIRGDVDVNEGGLLDADRGIYLDNANAIVDVNEGGAIDASNITITQADAKLNVNGGDITVSNNISNAGTITVNAAEGGILTAKAITGDGTITIDGSGFTGTKKIIDLSQTNSLDGKVNLVNGDGLSLVYGADGDVTLTDVQQNTIYVNTAWAGMTDGESTTEGHIYGFNAFADMAYPAIETAEKVQISGGTYSNAEGVYDSSVSLLKGGIKDVTTDGAVVVDKGSLVFQTETAGDINISGDYTTTDKIRYTGTWGVDWTESQNGHIRFVGGDDTVFNIDGKFTSGENIQFIGGKSVISKDSVLTVSRENYGQYAIYADVVNYGKMVIALDEENGAAMHIGYGSNEGSLTLSGADASLYVDMADGALGAADINVNNGSLIVEDGASVTSTGKVTVAAGSEIKVDDASVDFGSLANNGEVTVSGDSSVKAQMSGTGKVVFDGANLTDSDISDGIVRFKGENTYDGNFKASTVFVGDWENGEYTGSVDFGTTSDVTVNSQMIIGYDSAVAGANNVVFGDVDGEATDKVFKSSDVSVRRDGTLTIANTTGDNKISTMNVMGTVIVDNAKLSGEVQIGVSGDYVTTPEMIVRNGAEVNLGGSSNSVVVLGKGSNGAKLTIDDATVTVNRCGAGASYKVPADTFVIGYNGGTGELNVSNNGKFVTADYNGDNDGGLVNVQINEGSEMNLTTGGSADISGNVENSGLINVEGGNFAAGGDIKNYRDINVTDGEFTAGNVELLGKLQLTGLTAGDERQITVLLTPAGTEEGTSIQVTVPAGASSVNVDLTDFADGEYDLTILDGTVGTRTSGTVYNGKFIVDGGTVNLDALSVGNGSFDVTGESTVVIEQQTGTININDGAVMTDSKVGNINVYGTNTWQGTNTIGNMSIGWYNSGEDIVTNITGTATVTNFMIGNSEGFTSTLNIGDAEGERTTIKGNQHNYTTNSVVNVTNADVTGNYASMTGAITITDSTYSEFGDFRVVSGANHTITPQVTLTRSSINGSYGYVGGWSATASGYGDLTLQDKSTWKSNGGSLTTALSKVTVDDSEFIVGGTFTTNGTFTMTNGSTLSAKSVTNGGTISVTDSNVAVTGAFTNNGTFTVSGESTVNATVTGDVVFADGVVLGADTALTVDGNITSDGAVTFDWNDVAATKLSAKTLTINNVELPTDAAVTVFDGAADVENMVINGSTVANNQVVLGGNVYDIVFGDSDVTMNVSSDVYDPMTGGITSITQGEGGYTFTVENNVTGGEGDYTYSFAATDANGKALALTSNGLEFTLTDIPAAGTDAIFVTMTVTDAYGESTKYTAEAFAADVADYKAPEFAVEPEAAINKKSVKLTWTATDETEIAGYEIIFDGEVYEIGFGVSGKASSMTFNNLSEGDHTYVVKVYDGAGNLLASEEKVVTIKLNSNLSSNGVSQIVGFDAAAGKVGYLDNAGSVAPEWKGIWEWEGEEAGVWEVVGVGKFAGSEADQDGLLLFNKTNNVYAAWTDLNSDDYGYVSLESVDAGYKTVGLANFNGNEYDDILMVNEDGRIGVVMDGTTYQEVWSNDEGADIEVIGSGSFGAADGLDSLIVKNNTDNTYELWHNNASYESNDWSMTKLWDADSDWTVAAVGDFSGDGIDDIVVWQESTGYMFALEDGDASNYRWVGELDPNSWEVAAVGDYDGNGQEDLLLRETASGWGGLGYWGGAYCENWTDLNARIENDKNGSNFQVVA